MKLCFNHEDTVKEWFDRVTECDRNDPSLKVYGHNIRSYGYELCSYGDHFIIAKWCPEQRLFLTNYTERYSASTAKHQSYVRRHVPLDHIDVGPNISIEPSIGTLSYWHEMITVCLDNAKRARKRKQEYYDWAQRHLRDRNRFIKAFKLDAPELPEDVTAALVTLKLAA